jgi:hypothetical protein
LPGDDGSRRPVFRLRMPPSSNGRGQGTEIVGGGHAP